MNSKEGVKGSGKNFQSQNLTQFCMLNSNTLKDEFMSKSNKPSSRNDLSPSVIDD